MIPEFLFLTLILLGFIELFELVHNILSKNSIKSEPTESEDQSTVQEPRVLFFPDSKSPCPSYINSFARADAFIKCDRSCNSFHAEDVDKSSLVYILERMRGSREIDLCMYRFTLQEASDVLVKLKSKGVTIRIITDRVTEDLRSDRIPILKAAGIEVREMHCASYMTARERPLMHNKFVVIDRKICISGSFNWTWKGLMRNEEMVIEISGETVVEPIVRRFEEMWAKYDPRAGSIADWL